MKTRRSFLKTASTGALVAGLGVSPVFSVNKNTTHPVIDADLTKGLPDISNEDYLYRQNMARKWLEKTDIDAVFIEGGINLDYFTGMNWWMSERLFGFVLSRNADLVWVCPAFELKRAKEVINFGTDIRVWEEHESPYALLQGVMSDLGLAGGTLGIGPNVRNFVVEGIRKDTRLNLVNGAPVTEHTRAIKTEKELQYLDVANRITKLAYRDSFAQIQPGMSGNDLAALIRQAHNSYGASGGGSPLFGAASAFPHGTKDRPPLHEGDIILVDGGCSVKGYRSDVTRTIVLGKPSQRQRDVFDAVRSAQLKAFSIIREGLPCAEADAAARKVVEKAGFGRNYETFTHRLGHGIGREGHEFPYLVGNNWLKMESGMTFTNEPGIYLYGEFGVRIEDSFVVTSDGYHIFGEMPSLSLEKPFG